MKLFAYLITMQLLGHCLCQDGSSECKQPGSKYTAPSECACQSELDELERKLSKLTTEFATLETTVSQGGSADQLNSSPHGSFYTVKNDEASASYDPFKTILHTINSNPYLKMEWEKHLEKFTNPEDTRSKAFDHFNCQQQNSGTNPLSVHRLRPADVKVVAALGDSLTAGLGVRAWTIFGWLTEYRGRSWSIGGDKSYEQSVTTFPNILRILNSELTGYSLRRGGVTSRGANLNVAVSGSMAQNMPGQAQMLIERLQSDPNINYEQDWKVITVFIGGNNLCDYCNDRTAHSAQTYIRNIRQALDILHAEIPKAFVNLVEIFDVAPLANLDDGIICNIVHSYVCRCGHARSGANIPELNALGREYQVVTQDLITSGRYDTRKDFTVVLQPFFRDTKPPLKPGTYEPDLAYFAPDCFHFSSLGQAAAAKALWNTMLEPVSSKRTEWQLNDTLSCPTEERPYLATRFN